MRKVLTPLAAIAALLSSGHPALAQGPVGTVTRGAYVCELPGDASGAVGIAQPEEDFIILSASRYETAEGRGTYLRKGDRVTMTNGPLGGEAYQVVGSKVLRKLDSDGKPGRLRCLLRSR